MRPVQVASGRVAITEEQTSPFIRRTTRFNYPRSEAGRPVRREDFLVSWRNSGSTPAPRDRAGPATSIRTRHTVPVAVHSVPKNTAAKWSNGIGVQRRPRLEADDSK